MSTLLTAFYFFTFFSTLQAINYYYVPQPLTWSDARSNCQSTYGGDLAIADTLAKQQAIEAAVGGQSYYWCWIGGSDLGTEGTWKWINGDDFTYTNWWTNEPNGGTAENCACLYKLFGANNRWNDYQCQIPRESVCQDEPPTSDCDNWIYGMAKGSFGSYDIGGYAFDVLFQQSPNHIIRRECTSCLSSHKLLFYRRFTDTTTFGPHYFLTDNWRNDNNIQGNDFKLYSSLNDALLDINEWSPNTCNYNDPGIGFPRDCGSVGGQWNTFYSGRGGQPNVRYSIYAPNDAQCSTQTCVNQLLSCV